MRRFLPVVSTSSYFMVGILPQGDGVSKLSLSGGMVTDSVNFMKIVELIERKFSRTWGVPATWDIRSKKEGFCQKIDDQNALELHFSRTDIPSSQYTPLVLAL
jgi:hypothetical protein